MRRYTIRVASASESGWWRLLDDLRWDAGIDTLSAAWDAGEGEARVECFGDRDAVLGALEAAGRAGDVLAVDRD